MAVHARTFNIPVLREIHNGRDLYNYPEIESETATGNAIVRPAMYRGLSTPYIDVISQPYPSLADPQQRSQAASTTLEHVSHDTAVQNASSLADAQQAASLSVASDKFIKITLEGPAANPTPAAKPDPHPQEKLNAFYKNFDPDYYGKITRILPATDLTSAIKTLGKSDQGSQASPYSYEAAKARCTRDVQRIVRECRTLNKKYTDTHFDIERDLKIAKTRNCLDGLHDTLTTGDSADAFCGQPHDVKRVSDIFSKPTFFGKGALSSDIVQGKLGDCWLLAAMSILTCNERLLRDICVVQEPEVGVYGFVFFRDGEWHQTIIDDKLYLRAPSYDESGDVVLEMYGVSHLDEETQYNELFQKGNKALFFAQCSSENETWVPLLEKAFAKAHGSFAALIGGRTGEAIEDLTGGNTSEVCTTNILNKDKFWYDELCKIGKDFVFSAAVASYVEWRAGGYDSVRSQRRQGIVTHHAYAVLATYEGHGQKLVKMRNPWGNTEWTGPWSDGSKEWTSEWLERLNHKFGNDGVFWISYEDLLQRYKYLDRTRLFGPEWHVASQWTSCQVPWDTTDYQHTKFAITVLEKTEAVISIQQLDHRYFRGLQGKYDYNLHFRIQKDDEDENDYFARSPCNYDLFRGNSVEVDLEPGNYTVLFKIEATKTVRKDVAEVVKANIWNKERLMRIGALYDLAHQKARPNEQIIKEATPKPAAEVVEGGAAASQTATIAKDETVKDPWNACCVVGLRVFSRYASTSLKVVHPGADDSTQAVLDRDDVAKAALEGAQQSTGTSEPAAESGGQ